jgi:alpha-galactosidase
MRQTNLDYDLARKLFAQLKEISPDYLGDFYPLTPYSLSNNAWLAWQYDRPEADQGVIQAFRRPESKVEAAQFKLRGLEARTHYTVTDLDRPEDSKTYTGEQLMHQGLTINITDEPGAVVLTYKKVSAVADSSSRSRRESAAD